ncbi:DDE superfamily endonuclease [Azotobacter chroococcum]|uniref:DDE superfamily endonuclease n=1 Tax=Azotobacter chroococcum TaxID=353 RepID=A0A4R1P136_9GAMM|nr:DDE superfamily endonuclease [Azotobacter chroococcum]
MRSCRSAQSRRVISVGSLSPRAGSTSAWRLYLPREWAEDAGRRRKAGVPEDVRFATKPQISQLQALLEAGEPHHCVVADDGYGVDSAFRQGLTAMGLSYVVGVTSAVRVWPPGQQPLPPKPWTGKGRPPVATRRLPEHRPLSVKKLALSLPPELFTELTWRQGTNEPLSGRFAAVRVRPAGSVSAKQRLHPQQWLLIEWPPAQDKPTRYWLSTLAQDTPLPELVRIAHLRWRIERDYRISSRTWGWDITRGVVGGDSTTMPA